MDNETNILNMIRMDRRIAREEQDMDNVTVVLTVFEHPCLEHDHEDFLPEPLPDIIRH